MFEHPRVQDDSTTCLFVRKSRSQKWSEAAVPGAALQVTSGGGWVIKIL